RQRSPSTRVRAADGRHGWRGSRSNAGPRETASAARRGFGDSAGGYRLRRTYRADVVDRPTAPVALLVRATRSASDRDLRKVATAGDATAGVRARLRCR